MLVDRLGNEVREGSVLVGTLHFDVVVVVEIREPNVLVENLSGDIMATHWLYTNNCRLQHRELVYDI